VWPWTVGDKNDNCTASILSPNTKTNIHPNHALTEDRSKHGMHFHRGQALIPGLRRAGNCCFWRPKPSSNLHSPSPGISTAFQRHLLQMKRIRASLVQVQPALNQVDPPFLDCPPQIPDGPG